MKYASPHDMAGALLDSATGLNIASSGRHYCGSEWVVGPRVIEDHLMYYILDGAVSCRLNGNEIILPPETFFWIQPREHHHFVIRNSNQPAEIVFFRFFLGRKGIPVRLKAPCVTAHSEPWLRERLQELLPAHLPGGPLKEPAIRHQLGALICRLISRNSSTANVRDGLTLQQKDATIQYVRRNLATRFTLSGLAAAISLNPEYFSRQFRKTFGMPPQEWIKRERIHHAASQMVETGTRIKQIAISLGYEDLYFFSRQFKSVMGRSPRKYRTEHQSQ